MDVNLVDKLVGRNGFLDYDCCILCGIEDTCRPGFCTGCYTDLPLITSYCSRCARILPDPGICAECLLDKNGFVFSDCIVAVPYDYPVNKIIHHLKFNGRITFARPLGYLLEEKLTENRVTLPECLIPVPLHFTRQLYRGYNQSAEIARILSRQLQIPLDQHICKKTKPTRAQSLLRAEQRKRNIQGSIKVTGKVDYRHIAIVDDVMTTGNTVNEMARILVRAGVSRVSVWVCARSQK